MYCSGCGTEANEGDRFCRRCGGTLAEAADAAPAPVAPAPAPLPPGGAAGPVWGGEPVAPAASRSPLASPAPAAPSPPASTAPAPPAAPGAAPAARRVHVPGRIVRPRGPVLETAAGELELAGFGVRFGGWLIDVVVYAAVAIALSLLALAAAHAPDGGPSDARVETAGNISTAVWVLLLFAALWTFNALGWSPGKRALGLRIVDEHGARPGAGRGFGRTIGAIVSWIFLGLGFLWAAWDDAKQTWHDKMASTYVVRLG